MKAAQPILAEGIAGGSDKETQSPSQESIVAIDPLGWFIAV